MGLRPNRHPAAVSACRHPRPLVPVQVHDRLDGRPETVAHLCPDCYEPVTPPPLPPRGPGSVSARLSWDPSTGDLGPL